jgi:drug/metabolite transporter (DMT)-like permease
MLWLALSIFVAIASSMGGFIDNYVTDVSFKGRKPEAQKIFGIPVYFLVCLIIAIFFPLVVPLPTALALFGAGVISALASIFYYRALKSENTTGAAIFLQLSPVLYLIAGWAILGERISPLELFAFCLIIAAPLIIIFSSGKRRKKLELRAAFLFLAYVVLAVAANIIFLNQGADTTFPAAFFYFILGKFATDLTLSLIMKSWRIRFKDVLKTARWKFIVPMTINEIMFVAVDITYRLALTLAPVAIVSVLTNSVELIATFVLGLILTAIWPIFGREKLNKRTTIAHLIATVLAAAGIIILQ